MNTLYKKNEFRRSLSAAFRERRTMDDDSAGAVFYLNPFPCCVLDNFLLDSTLLLQLETDLREMIFHQKTNDLYKFQQTDDLRESQSVSISSLREFLMLDVKDWMKEVTGIHLNDHVDATCSIYRSTDTLLCHDDELEGRRIAFIYYFVRDWALSDGGTLDLFSADECGQPDTIALSLVPKWNSFVFFEVSPISFHQVTEVLSSDKNRMSVSGWFYGEPIDYPQRFHEAAPLAVKPRKALMELLFDCVNSRYFDPDVQARIRRQFEEESSIELQHFLLEHVYKSLVDELEAVPRRCWNLKGPANRRKYEELDDADGFETILKLFQLFQSEPMFLLLSQLTGLELSDGSCVEEEREDSGCENANGYNRADETVEGGSSCAGLGPCCVECVRRWSHGSYTLLRDMDKTDEYFLDTSLFVAKEGWETDYGGFVSYIAQDEDEELLSAIPKPNVLALVYRDKETLKFVKHINSCATTNGYSEYFEISVSYWE